MTGRLHRILQVAMGWTESHLHLFEVGDMMISDPGFEWESEFVDQDLIRLNQAAPKIGAKFLYEYDMGDCWRHEIVVERIDEDEKSTKIVCTGGERACPPEDVGGESGYQEFVIAIADPTAEDHASLLEWAGGKFDPEAFDLVAVNRKLKQLR